MPYQVVVWLWKSRTDRLLLKVGAGVATLLFSIINVTADDLTLAWNPSSSPDVASYNVYYGVASGAYDNEVSAGDATNMTITGLSEGTTYYFAATSVDTSGNESPFSNEISYLLPTDPPVTNPPVVVDEPPTVDPPAGVTVNENAGQQTVGLTGISAGVGGQSLIITATSSNPSLVPNPIVNYSSPNATGSLNFTPAAGSCGTATITVTVNNQAASNNIVTQSFLVTVNAVNQPPTLNALTNLTINENASQQTVNLGGISSGAANQTQTLLVTATSSNPSLIPNPSVTYTSPGATGSLSFAPATNNNGTATITVSVNNQGASNNIVTQSFLVAVAAVNQPPTLNALTNLTINENASPQTVNLSGIGSGAANQTQTLVVTAVSGNPSLIPNPTITYASANTSGTLKFAPVTNSYGTATITATVNNGGLSNNIVSHSFVVTVNPVNQAPTLAALNNVAVVAACGKQVVNLTGISSGLVNSSQPVTITASSSSTQLIPKPAISYVSPSSTGTLSFTPAGTATGTATLSVTVNNGQNSKNTITRSLVVTVLAKGSTAPALTSPFTNRVALAGQTVNLSVAATGTKPLAYQWQCNSEPLPGATNATLSLANVTASQSGEYSVPSQTCWAEPTPRRRCRFTRHRQPLWRRRWRRSADSSR